MIGEVLTAACDVLNGVLLELRTDLEEVVTLIFEQFGVQDIWGTLHTFGNGIRGSFGQKHDVGCRRSIVRLLGSKLPLKPAKRAHFRIIKEVRGVAKIDETLTAPENDSICRGEWMDGNHLFMNVQTSTPKSHYPLASEAHHKGDVENPELSSLHKELAKLRSHVVDIVTRKNSTQCPLAAPPPPPPPLPSCPLYNVGANVKLSIGSRPVKAIQNDRKSVPCTPNLMDVLKDLGKVKLRRVERSPGGTPLRLMPPKLCDVSDPAAILAAALKKRFSRLQPLQESYETDLDEQESTWNSTNSSTLYSTPLKQNNSTLNNLNRSLEPIQVCH